MALTTLVFALLAMPVSQAPGDHRLLQALEVYQGLLKASRDNPPAPADIHRFQARNQAFQVVAHVPAIVPVAVPNDLNGGKPVGLAVKVWAELVPDPGQDGPGSLVSLERHRWSPGQRFHLWFDSATPILIAFYQLAADKGSARFVLPTPTLPASFGTIPAGRPVKYPVLMQVDNDAKTEHMAILVTVPGAAFVDQGPLALSALPADATPTQVREALARTSEQFARVTEPLLQGAAGPVPPADIVSPDGAPARATVPGDVASILLGPGPTTCAHLTLRKR